VDALIETTDTVSPLSATPSSFFLALVPTARKQLLADVPTANLVASPECEMPGGQSQFGVLLAAPSSPSSNQVDAASRLAHPSQGRAWKYSAVASTKSEVKTNNSLINFLAAPSCLVTGEL
jgi:hypothetical protein